MGGGRRGGPEERGGWQRRGERRGRRAAPRGKKRGMRGTRGYGTSIVASTAMTASLTIRVVSRNWSADRARAPSSIRAIVEEIPKPKAQTPNPNCNGSTWVWAWDLGFGIWVLGFSRYDRKDDWTSDYRADDD